jgi:putative drug exporter of the RND superfamily
VFERLGKLATRRFGWVILAWLVVAGVVQAVAPALRDVATYDETAFLTADAESIQAVDVLAENWPNDEFGNSGAIVITHDGGLRRQDLAYVDALEAWLRSDQAPAVVRGTQSVRTRPELRDVLSSKDGTTTILIVQFNTPPFEPPTNEAVVDIRKHLEASAPADLAVHLTGNAGVAADQSNTIQESIDRTTVITLVLVVLILLWVYRSPVTLGVPLLTIGIAFVVAQGIVALLAQAGMKVSSLVETFMIVIIFGAGTDYCLFVISRFREEVGFSREYKRTLATTVAVVGAVIASSAGTVIVGFTAQGVAKFGMFRTVGPAMAVAVAVTLVAGLTLTPALMRAFGRKLFWPAHPEALAAAGALPELQVSEALGILPRARTAGRVETPAPAQALLPAPTPPASTEPEVVVRYVPPVAGAHRTPAPARKRTVASARTRAKPKASKPARKAATKAAAAGRKTGSAARSRSRSSGKRRSR